MLNRFKFWWLYSQQAPAVVFGTLVVLALVFLGVAASRGHMDYAAVGILSGIVGGLLARR